MLHFDARRSLDGSFLLPTLRRLFKRSKSSFTIVEVGPRDGLQNEKTIVDTRNKVTLINRLANTGLKVVESTSFVSPKWVPQMADHNQVVQKIDRMDGVLYPVLVPNMEGLKNAIGAGVKEISIFTSASETFSRKNVNCGINESLARCRSVVEHALTFNVPVRGYISCVLGCPYEGPISPPAVIKTSLELLDMGCYEISLGDTIGVGTAGSMSSLLDQLLVSVPVSKVAVHCHDTYGQALANVLIAIEKGVLTVDSSVSGLGGCPFARGASGNLATEDLLYMLNGLGIHTGVDMDKLLEVSYWISDLLGRFSGSKVSNACSTIANMQNKRKINFDIK